MVFTIDQKFLVYSKIKLKAVVLLMELIGCLVEMTCFKVNSFGPDSSCLGLAQVLIRSRLGRISGQGGNIGNLGKIEFRSGQVKSSDV